MSNLCNTPMPRRSPRLIRSSNRSSSQEPRDTERRLDFHHVRDLEEVSGSPNTSPKNKTVLNSVNYPQQNLIHETRRSSLRLNITNNENGKIRHLNSPLLSSDANSEKMNALPLLPSNKSVLPESRRSEKQVRASKADEISAAFSFLIEMNVKQLRCVLKDWKWKQSGNKKSLVARAFLHLKLLMLAGKPINESLLSHQETERFKSWFEHKVDLDLRSPLYLSTAPDEEEVFDLLEVKEVSLFKNKKNTLERSKLDETNISREEDTEVEGGVEDIELVDSRREEERTSENEAFSINEFARLCIVLRDDEDAKCALSGTGQELTRSQLDAGITRESYWGVIENRFNDKSLRLRLNMTGNVEGVDSPLAPPCHRSDDLLKDKFVEAKKTFTSCVSKWSRSGQNDCAGFKRFVKLTRAGELTAEGKRMMVLFVCTKKGTEYEDVRFSNLCCKVIPFDGGFDEGGGEGDLANGLSRGNRKRRNRENDVGESLERSIQTYTSVKLEELRNRFEKKKRDSADDAHMKRLQQRQWYVDSIVKLETTVKSTGLDNGRFKDTLSECANLQLEELRKAFMMPQIEAVSNSNNEQVDHRPALTEAMPCTSDDLHNKEI